VKVLVTGGAGFIGSHLVERLLGEPDVGLVRAVDSLTTGKRENVEPLLDRAEYVEGDLLDAEVRERAVRGVDVVFHQAAIPSVPRSVANPLEAHRNGAHLTALLLESARLAGVRRFVLAASSSCYGDTETLPKHEAMAPNPLSPYAATKVACEQYVKAYARCYAMDAVSLRYFNVFGPRQDPSSPYSGVIARFCLAFCKGERPVIFGDGTQTRDFTYVSNVVDANLRAARHPGRLGGEVFNVGAGVQTSLAELVALFNEITGQDLRPIHEPARAGDVLHSLADVGKIERTLGYRPAVSLREGLGRTLAWYRGEEELRASRRRARLWCGVPADGQ
jgi:UDP-glucose 4-epimerase